MKKGEKLANSKEVSDAFELMRRNINKVRVNKQTCTCGFHDEFCYELYFKDKNITYVLRPDFRSVSLGKCFHFFFLEKNENCGKIEYKDYKKDIDYIISECDI